MLALWLKWSSRVDLQLKCTWINPFTRLRRAVERRETIELRIVPEVCSIR